MYVQDVIFSFLVKCKGGKWEVVQDLSLDDFSKPYPQGKLKAAWHITFPEAMHSCKYNVWFSRAAIPHSYTIEVCGCGV